MRSGGVKQRNAPARALANDPKVLRMDEPFGALDQPTRELMQELLLDIWREHRETVLCVTQDIDEAVFMANRFVVMNARRGRIEHEARIAFPHPRDDRIKTTVEFAAHKARLIDEIRVETRRAALAAPR